MIFSLRHVLRSTPPLERPLGSEAVINTVSKEFGPCLADSNTTLYFYSDRTRDLGSADIRVTRRVPKGTRKDSTNAFSL